MGRDVGKQKLYQNSYYRRNKEVCNERRHLNRLLYRVQKWEPGEGRETKKRKAQKEKYKELNVELDRQKLYVDALQKNKK